MTMRRAVAVLVAVLAGEALPQAAEAQATGMPSYNAPYRAFQRSELGGVFSFPEGGGTAFEGVYRYASGKFDIGLRGGFFDPGSGFKTVDRKSTRLNSSHSQISYAVFCLKKKTKHHRAVVFQTD